MTKVIFINIVIWGAIFLFSIKNPENMIFISVSFVISLIITGKNRKNEKENKIRKHF
jgi:hypothetical protein